MTLRYIGDAQWTALDADAKPTNAAVADTLTTLDTRRIFIHQGAAVWIEIGTGTGGGGGGGGGFAAGGTIAKSGNGTSTVISIAHGLSPTPDLYYALPLNEAARGIISYGIDGTNINLTYPIAPASGSNNLSYVWGAGYVNSASGGFTPTSTTTMTGKTMSNDSNTFPYVGAYNAIIYKSGSVYKAKSGDGTLLDSSTTLDTVVQAALDQKGLILWPAIPADGSYTPSTTLPGWQFKSDTTLVMSANTRITVNKGSTGSLFKINDTYGGNHIARNIIISGGKIQEFGSPPDALWKAFEITSEATTLGTSGVTTCILKDIWIKRCNIGIELNSNLNATSWISGNRFDNIIIDTPYIGIQFNQSNIAGEVNGTIFRNMFSNVIVQAGTADDTTTLTNIYGMKDISGTNNMFLDCKMWDQKPTRVSCNISNKARDTVIVGGLMAWRPYDWEVSQDFGERTYVVADWQTGSNLGVGNPFLRKTGTFYGQSSNAVTTVSGTGLLDSLGVHATGTYTAQTPTASGSPRRIDSTATINTIAAIRTNINPFVRYFNPLVIIRFKPEVLTNQRIFVGYISSPLLPTHATQNDPLVSLAGYGLFHSTSHPTSGTNWLVCKNTGTAASTFTNTGIAVDNTKVQTFYLALWEDGPKAQWRIGNIAGQIGEDTTSIPGQFSAYGFGIYIANITAANKRIDVFDIFAKEGKSNPTL